ncbi:MAG: hypothetical protein C0599_07630 [Salinivirgaceae bacterium]|nr:MAG: hypothetical protein C0599_07630 [Salinivirgaceae bacterium]
MKLFKFFSIVGLTFLFISCGGPSIRFEKTPLDKVIQDLSAEQNFSIILYDMDYDEGTNKYKHMYQTLVPKDDTVLVNTTPWYDVPDVFFEKNVDNMGMEIASKVNGKLNKKASPPGYNHYVGNDRYGRWTQRNGSSFWEFYGQYAFMSSMFGLGHNPIRRSYYDDYRTNYYGSRAYYGPSNNGRNYYGTRSNYNTSRSSTNWTKKPSTFKDKVRSKVKQSASVTRKSRISRSSSRSSSSSFRSRGGGFGK